MNTELVNTLDALFIGQEQNIEKATRCLKVLAHPARLKILCVLKEGEHSVQDIEKYTSIAQATLSQHLSVLKDRGVVASRRDGNYSMYRISNQDMISLFDMIKNIFCVAL
jgi:DNA-binding transcriptional ArsR family regulator